MRYFKNDIPLPTAVKMCSVFVFCILCTVAVLTNEVPRLKRQNEDRWSWGYFEETTTPVTNDTSELVRIFTPDPGPETTPTTTPTTTMTPTTTTTPQPPPIEPATSAPTTVNVTTTAPEAQTIPNFCRAGYVPPKMPTRPPGTRISTLKCYEYIWKLQERYRVIYENNICEKFRSFHPYVVGGRLTLPGEFPHMGALGWKAVNGTWVFKCGSSLISEKFVLTAAHCSQASKRDASIEDVAPKIVRLGDKNIMDVQKFGSPPKKDVAIARIIVHPQYKAPVKYHDIALIELAEKVKFYNYVQPACLWNSVWDSKLNGRATLTGWGVVKSGTLETSPELRAAVVDLLDSDQCDKLLKEKQSRNWNGFHKDQICAGKLIGGVDSCQGDSGGPLQSKINLAKNITDQEGSMHFVIGVISFGVGCAHPNLPGVYTRVSSYLDWIEENVWGNNTST